MPQDDAVAGLILAAGRSTRMAPVNKLLAGYQDAPVVTHAAVAALDAGLSPVIAVTGHQADQVAAVLEGMDVDCVHNALYASGLASSVKAGISALPDHVSGTVILLGDMPGVSAEILRALVSAFHASGGEKIIQPRYDGKPGNPILWPRRLFTEFGELSGDVGAKPLLAKHSNAVMGVDVSSPAIHMDIDTSEDLTD